MGDACCKLRRSSQTRVLFGEILFQDPYVQALWWTDNEVSQTEMFLKNIFWILECQICSNPTKKNGGRTVVRNDGVMMMGFSDSESHETGFEGIHLLVCKNSHGFFFFLSVCLFMCDLVRGYPFQDLFIFPTTIRAIDTRKMKKQKWDLRVVGSFFFFSFPYSFLILDVGASRNTPGALSLTKKNLAAQR